jgi:hypothetical protein
MSHPDPLYDYHDDFYGEDWNDVMEDNMVEEDYYDDSMDGDAESAFGSCGWGVDEQYNADYDYGDDW